MKLDIDVYKNELINALKRATSLVGRLVSKEISIEQFVDEYDNFFYYEALDGHESNAQQRLLLSEFAEVVSFHERVQHVIDLVYLGSSKQKQQYVDAGRVDLESAEQKIRFLANEYDVTRLLEHLN